MKRDLKVVYACNPDVPQKALSQRSQKYFIVGNLKQRICKLIQRGWLKTAPEDIIGER